MLLRLRDDPGVRVVRPGVDRARKRIPDQLAEAIRLCCDAKAPWPLFVHGNAGSGKTCAALYLVDRAVSESQFWDFADLVSTLADAKCGRGWWGDQRITPAAWWEWWTMWALCVIDEIGGRDSVTDHAYDTLKAAIDSREGKPLLVLSNIGLDNISRLYDDRIASRLAGGTVVHVEGDDQRLQKET